MASLIGNKPNQVPSNGDLGTLAFQDAGNVQVGTVTHSGNLTFTGTGNRIIGDFNNGTIANRPLFQSSVTNSNSTIGVIPNGTSAVTAFQSFNNSDPTNSSVGTLRSSTGDIRIESTIAGTGTYLPLTMYTGGSERLRIDTSGNVGIGNSSPNTNLDITGTQVLNRGVVQALDNTTQAAGTGSGLTLGGRFNASSALTPGIQVKASKTNGTAGDYGFDMAFLVYKNGDANMTERMRIDSNGLVGIGLTPSGTTVKLQVSTDALISGLTVGKGGGAVATNTVLGASALSGNTTGTNNIAIGTSTLQLNSTGNQNTAVGFQTLYPATSSGNTGVGFQAGTSTTTGLVDAFGYRALYLNTTGASNVAIGFESLRSNTTASNNTAVGYQAGYTNTTSAYSTFVGYQAGYNSNYTGGANNLNCFIGAQSGFAVTTGINNTIIGSYSGNQGGLDIRTASNYIVLSDGTGNPRGIFDNNGSFTVGKTGFSASVGTGFGFSPNAQQLSQVVNTTVNTFLLYNSTASAYRFFVTDAGQINATSTSITAISDISLKENIRDLDTGLTQVLALKPRRFDWKEETKIGAVNVAGFIAQELEEVLPELVYDYQYNETDTKKSIKMGDILPTLVKAIQELNAKVEAQALEIATLKGK